MPEMFSSIKHSQVVFTFNSKFVRQLDELVVIFNMASIKNKKKLPVFYYHFTQAALFPLPCCVALKKVVSAFTPICWTGAASPSR